MKLDRLGTVHKRFDEAFDLRRDVVGVPVCLDLADNGAADYNTFGRTCDFGRLLRRGDAETNNNRHGSVLLNCGHILGNSLGQALLGTCDALARHVVYEAFAAARDFWNAVGRRGGSDQTNMLQRIEFLELFIAGSLVRRKIKQEDPVGSRLGRVKVKRLESKKRFFFSPLMSWSNATLAVSQVSNSPPFATVNLQPLQ